MKEIGPGEREGNISNPYQEADETISRLTSLAAPYFDEFLILEFIATNDPPFPFRWVNAAKTARDYGAIRVRVSNRY
jgi:hypothetical protein